MVLVEASLVDVQGTMAYKMLDIAIPLGDWPFCIINQISLLVLLFATTCVPTDMILHRHPPW